MKKVLLIVILAYAVLALFVNMGGLWWDPAVYVGMGQAIFSGGSAGLWEASRPLVWPLLIGVVWPLGEEIAVQTLGVLLGMGVLVLTYLLTKTWTDEKTAVLATILLASLPLFLIAPALLLTGLPAIFFMLLGIYLFLQKKYYLGGLFLGLSVMTRFLMLFMVILFAASLFKQFLKPRIISRCVIGFLTAVIPYFILNMILYGNPLHPFFLQLFMTQNTGWPWHQSALWYLPLLFGMSWLVLLSPLGMWESLKQHKLPAIIFLGMFLFHVWIPHKEPRFLIPLMPFLMILTAMGMRMVFKRNVLVYAAIVLVLLQSLIVTLSWPPIGTGIEVNPVVDGEVWVSNPLYLVKSDLQRNLLYYPTHSSEQVQSLPDQMQGAESIVFSECDIPCPPWDDFCPEKTEVFISWLYDHYDDQILVEGTCPITIFS